MNYLSRFSSLGLLAVTLAGCAGSLPPQQANQKKDNLSQQVIDEMLCPVVKVDVERNSSHSRGSGFGVYDDEGKKSYVFTAAHVIGDGVVRVNGYTATSIRKNKFYDLELLEIQGGTLSCHFKGKLAKHVKIGDHIAVVGYPAMQEKALYLGYVASEDVGSGAYSDVYEIFRAPQHIVADVPLASGSSGSPVYVFKEGKPYLGGIIQGLYLNKLGSSGFVPVEVLRGFVKGTPLADELLEE